MFSLFLSCGPLSPFGFLLSSPCQDQPPIAKQLPKPMPQTLRKSSKNPPQHLPKSMPKPFKIEPKTSQNRGLEGIRKKSVFGARNSPLLGKVLGRPGGVLGASWARLGAVLGPSWGVSGASWGHYMANMAPSWLPKSSPNR